MIRLLRPSHTCGVIVYAMLSTLLMQFSVQTSHAQNEHEIVSGRVVRLEDSIPMSGTHIINITRGRGTITNSEGVFSIKAISGDSLLFSAIGFESDTIDITIEVLTAPDLLIVYLEEQLYEIEAVDIFPLPPTYDGFKRELIYGFDSVPQHYSIIRDLAVVPSKTGPSPVRIYGSPITYFYNLLSREGKEVRKYREILSQESMRGGWSLNSELVRQITGLEEDEQILDFFDFCGFTTQMLTISTELEVTEAISECFNKFNKLKEDEIR